MKKIFDWTVGSFFRTIGRTIAFFVMAMLVYYLLSYNDIDFGIKNLFFERVKADSYGNALVSFNTCDSGSCSLLVNAPTIYGVTDTISGQTISRITKFHTWNFTTTVPSKSNKVEFLFLGRSQFNNGLDLNISAYITTNKGQTWCNSISYSGNEGYYTISCPIISGTTNITQIAITTVWNFEVATAGQLQQGLSPLINYSYDGTQAIIDNQNQNTQQVINATEQQTQQQQQQHQETMNSSTTDAENDATSFFGNFTVEDQGGLSAIITAPLNTIRSLLSSTCADLVLPLPFVEEDLTLPCMYSIYSEHFGAFFSLYQTIILGIIAYRCIMSIFFDIKGFTNPNDDRIEVMDL